MWEIWWTFIFYSSIFSFRAIFDELKTKSWFFLFFNHNKGEHSTPMDGWFSGDDKDHTNFQLLTNFFHFKCFFSWPNWEYLYFSTNTFIVPYHMLFYSSCMATSIQISQEIVVLIQKSKFPENRHKQYFMIWWVVRREASKDSEKLGPEKWRYFRFFIPLFNKSWMGYVKDNPAYFHWQGYRTYISLLIVPRS